MRARIVGAIAIVIVAIIAIPWLIAQVHAPRSMMSGPSGSPGVLPAVDVPEAGTALYALPSLQAGQPATATGPTAIPATSTAKSVFDLPSLASGSRATQAPLAPVAKGATPEAKSAAAAGEPDTGWALQAASFSDRKSAETLAARLRRAGIPVFFAAHPVGATVYYRVMAGPYPSATAARAAAASVGELSGTTAILHRLAGSGG